MKKKGLNILIQENHVMIIGNGNRVNCGDTIKRLLNTIEGKGGGNKTFAEGKFTKVNANIISNIFENSK